ncbi:MAG TPA: ABC transporter ATP-binding protein [Treponemataceae bacterium]|nr:ABC transporter ATP-binding protein [Treponemataceae bacterium]
MKVISVKNVCFGYDAKPFIRDVSFSVGRGEVFGFLGPSGAGKSTLQKILTGLLTGYHGDVSVCGVDMRHRNPSFYERIGVDFEFPTLYEKLTARENLEFFGSLYKKKARPALESLEMVGLELDADKKVGAFSKGMKSRLNFAKAIAHDPDVLFLDEPTSGLDPANSRQMKDIIRSERDLGKAIILTTHNMHDAAELCDRVAFIVDGSVRALDTPRNLMLSRGAAKIRYSWIAEDGEGGCARESWGETILSGTGADSRLRELIGSGKLVSIHSQEPSLEDIFMDVTGRGLA